MGLVPVFEGQEVDLINKILSTVKAANDVGTNEDGV